MYLGIVIPTTGALATADAAAGIARQAESLGYDSLWFGDRDAPVLAGRNRHAAPASVDPLAVAASETARIGLGLTLSTIPFASPIAMAERLGRVERQTPGRLIVGLGAGSSVDEAGRVVEALAGSTPACEFLAAFDAIWACNPDGFRGEYFVVPGRRTPCTQQGSRVPMALSVFSPAAVQPSRAILDGVDTLAQPPVAAAETLDILGATVAVAGPERAVVARLPMPYGSTAGRPRALLSGRAGQVVDDIVAIRATGVSHLAVDLSGGRPDVSLSLVLDRMAWFREIAALAGARAGRIEAVAA